MAPERGQHLTGKKGKKGHATLCGRAFCVIVRRCRVDEARTGAPSARPEYVMLMSGLDYENIPCEFCIAGVGFEVKVRTELLGNLC
jgi:hypothetical protein